MRNAILSSFLLLSLFPACGSETQAKIDPMVPPIGLDKARLVMDPANPLTAEKAELGKKLFFDPRLSKSGKMGCVQCHHIDKAFTDGVQFSTKDNGKKNKRNSPTMYNVGYYHDFYWDGRKKGLESNVLAAWTGQLGGVPAEVAAKLNAIDEYKKEFQGAFQKDASEETIVHALASFLRTLRTGNSPYDKKMLSGDAQEGLKLFQTRGCQICHVPPLFSDKLYHNVGIGMKAENPDIGRAKPTGDESKTGQFKTPTLRNIAKTAPYFHDGSVKTLREAVKLMASGGIDNPHKDSLLMDQGLDDKQIDQLVAFLESLSDPTEFVAPQLPK